MTGGLVMRATDHDRGRNTSDSLASPFVSPRQPIPPARAAGRAGAASIAAGIASGFVAAVALYLLTASLAGLEGTGTGAIAVVAVLIVPVAGIVTLLVPFAAGMIGGIVAGRSVAAIGSIAGVLVGLWTGSKLAGSDPMRDATPEGLLVVVAVFGVVTLIGHLTGAGLSQALRRR